MAIIKLNNRGVKDATAFGSISSLGSLTLIKKQTASSSSTISFVDGSSGVVLDNTYKEYIFYFVNIHPATDSTQFLFQGNASGESGFNETITSTSFEAEHYENDFATGLTYLANGDQAQGTAFQRLSDSISNDNDHGLGGYLHLFNPSSTTYVKHFITSTQATLPSASQGDFSMQYNVAGYFNTTSAIDEIQFKMSSGNIDSGDILLFGLN